MGRCIIFCAGEFDEFMLPFQPDDYVIAADGGLGHLRRLSVVPDEVLGDFDSLGYTPENAAVYPVEKDDTDAMLAVRRGLSLGYREFILYGSLDGPRLDHTLANLQVLEFLARQGAVGYLVGTSHIATLVKSASLHFSASAEGIVSVFCLGEDARGVNLAGLKYPMENGTLTAGFPLGVSNHFVGKLARISVAGGSLWVIYDRCNGLPERGEALC